MTFIGEKIIGIIGGGQLGRMMIQECSRLDLNFVVLDPAPGCPAAGLADDHIVADFHDEKAIKALAERSDLLTYEFEHIDADTLSELARQGARIYPHPWNLQMIKNKLEQKNRLNEEGIPVPEYTGIRDGDDLKTAAERFGFPFMLKSCRGGYDGQGNYRVDSSEEIDRAFSELEGGERLLMAERFVPYEKEISAQVCRRPGGESRIYPLAENVHEKSILIKTRAPAEISAEGREKALKLARDIADFFETVGIFCIEMFVIQDENEKPQVLINEIAPRPHNSGHHTIESCHTSQFENHIRAILDVPLGSTELISPAAMHNLLGQNPRGNTEIAGLEEALTVDKARVHIYGKKTAYRRRKMGHVTARGANAAAAMEKAEKASQKIDIYGKEE